MEDNKLPKLNITAEELVKLLEDPKLKEELQKRFDDLAKIKPKVKHFNCDLCHDTKIVPVYGGPSRDCPCCGPRY